ncbi:MAG TPA: PAS domain-containing protein, partial [Burkholderiales bacterium]|nr:PAS domain-containing protein [Burkholderiales bacterium]
MSAEIGTPSQTSESEAHDARADLFRSALRAAEVGVWENDLETGDNIWGDGMVELLRVAPEHAETESKRWLEYLHCDDRARVMEKFVEHAHTGQPGHMEFRVVCADGAVRWFSCRFTVLVSADGHRRMLGMVQDITTNKEAEERLALALKAGQAGTFDWDAATNRRVWSEEQLALYGVKREEFGGRHEDWLNCVVPEDRERAANALKRAMQTGIYTAEFRIRRRDNGEIRWIHGRGRVFFDSTHKPVRMMGINVDISARMRAEMSARQWRYADSRKTEFLAMLAHELRNPLSAIRSGVEALNLSSGSEVSLPDVRAMITRQVQHMTRVIDDLFDVGRISQGKLDLRLERSTLAAVIQQSLDLVNPHIGHELMIALPPDPVHFNADPVRLVQAFSNLLSNASKYTPTGGRIAVAARREGGDAIVSIKDTGIGISPDHLPHVFEMFWQATASVDTAGGLGLGLGLALTRALVQMHGGSIEARSDGLGKGSEFIVRLPCVSNGGPAEQERRAQPASSASTGPHRILVVDDNRDVAESLATLLALDGHKVQVALDGAQALESASRWPPDIVLLDLGLPGMSGYDVCRAMRAQQWGSNATILAVSGWGQPED